MLQTTPRSRYGAAMSTLSDRILDATAQLLDQRGLAGVNTNAIAKQAECSVGSVYVYFRNKQEVLAALLQRHGDRLLAAIAASLIGGGAWRDQVARTVDAFVTFYRDEPGYRELWLGAQLTDETVRAGQAWGQAATEQLGAALQALQPTLPSSDAARAAEVSIYVVSTLVTRALQAGDDALIAEAKQVVIRYLAPLLDGGSAER